MATISLCHAGPVWRRKDPRVTILHAYSHLATHCEQNVSTCRCSDVSQVFVRTGHRLNVPPVVLRSLPREKLCVLLPTPLPLHTAAFVQSAFHAAKR